MLKRIITVAALAASPVLAIDEAHRARAEAMIEKSIAYLRAQQDASGGFVVNPQGPNLPAITGLVLTGALLDHNVDPADPLVTGSAAYILKFRQPDGGIYDRILPSYNTAICVSALTLLEGEEAKAAVGTGVGFLRTLQYGETAATSGEAGTQTKPVGPDHPFYGGVGYGSGGRPDNSNLNFFLQALQDAGVAHDDPAVKRAVVFLSRTQMLDATNDQAFADGSRQGGFVYSTGPNEASPGAGESKGPMIEETLSDGTVASRLRAYGSMTYAGFKSFAYARLAPDDPRVVAAKGWISRNYTLEENPGVGTDGLYYYLMTFGRAMDASGRRLSGARNDGVDVLEGDTPATRDWANDLVDRLAALQNEDGSFRSVDDRWMENNPVLITAYALIALRAATPE
ncbi:MAG: hypothetical protein IT439_12540 [Phycisphaerales bacterium]|nr:hypothetical protein [Phycisphaerales bacterium]